MTTSQRINVPGVTTYYNHGGHSSFVPGMSPAWHVQYLAWSTWRDNLREIKRDGEGTEASLFECGMLLADGGHEIADINVVDRLVLMPLEPIVFVNSNDNG